MYNSTFVFIKDKQLVADGPDYATEQKGDLNFFLCFTFSSCPLTALTAPPAKNAEGSYSNLTDLITTLYITTSN